MPGKKGFTYFFRILYTEDWPLHTKSSDHLAQGLGPVKTAWREVDSSSHNQGDDFMGRPQRSMLSVYLKLVRLRIAGKKFGPQSKVFPFVRVSSVPGFSFPLSRVRSALFIQ